MSPSADLGAVADGSYVQSTVMGNTGSGTNQVISTFTAMQLSDRVSLTADFTPVSSGPLTIDYFSGGPNGSLVYTEQYVGTTAQLSMTMESLLW